MQASGRIEPIEYIKKIADRRLGMAHVQPTTWMIAAMGLAIGVMALNAGAQAQASRPAVKSGGQRAPDVAESQLRERAIEMLVEFASDQSPQLRANALEALVRVPTRLGPIAAAGLVDSSPAVRAVAAMALGKARLKAYAPSIEPLLRDDSPFVRISAVFGLSKLGAQVDPTPLAGWLLGDPSVNVRSHAAFVLGELGNASAIALLREAGKSIPRVSGIEAKLFSLQLAEARAKLGDTSQVEVLRSALYPGSPEDYEAALLAVQALGTINDKSAKDSILIEIDGPRVREGKAKPPAEFRLLGALAMAKMGAPKGAVDLALELSENAGARERVHAAAVFAEGGTRAQLPLLEKWMSDPDASIRMAAAWAAIAILDRL
jgi:HEAT repeat protein